jgi:hypothetical protein
MARSRQAGGMRRSGSSFMGHLKRCSDPAMPTSSRFTQSKV